ncbi:cingulin-like protein 1 isoform X2 [Diachasma alloeum]|uniref:cingulin-like protein 1 isoform X2 n=1 Tax=Diachasma alloeum TaxID=454923 RepID=UPI000738208F|nr:cingulin-like protein 1 isoform X2 [Diachasma alloeum]
MGMGHSLHNQKDYEPPPLPSPFGPGGPFQGFPRTSRVSQASLHSSVASNPQNQESRPRDSLRNDEWWHQPPPPAVNLRQPHEALLTYATQMTGWQSEYAPGVPVHQEAMELTRTVSCLAAANQQLAAAHSALLGQLEGLYLELSKEREASVKKCDDDLRRRVEVVEGVMGAQCQCSGRKVEGDWRSVKKKGRGDGDEEYVRREYQRAVERIRVLESELKGGREEDRSEGLVREVRRLREEQVETKEVNKRLRRELERVRRDYEVSKDYFKAMRETSEDTARRIGDSKGTVRENSIQTDEVERPQGGELEESLKEIQRLNDVISSFKRVQNSDAEPLHDISPETSTEEESVERPTLDDFKKDLCLKREARQRAIAAVSSEMDRLRKELDAEKEAHSETSKVLDLLKTQSEKASRKSETFSIGTATAPIEDAKVANEWPEPNSIQKDAQRLTDVLKVSDELRGCIRLQIEKIDDLRYHLECEPELNAHRIETLEAIARSNRDSFETREHQMNRLKNMLSQILARLGDDKFKIEISEDLRTEHDHQVEDIRRLKALYDERMRVLVDLKDSATKDLLSTRHKLKGLVKEKESLDEDLKKAEEKIDAQDTEVSNLESQLGLTKADCRDLQNQMSLINSLFSQMLLSASSADMDLDRLTQLLQENHDLISDMAREEGTEAAALPKLLLDLVEQVEGREKSKSSEGSSEKKEDEAQEESIANNLPKVWKVLTELLSCHAAGSSASTSSTLLSNDPNSCYKSVDTPTGPRLVISVSKTYIRLKELILEKKHLEKEMGRMKQLNSHLESKLGEQEKRLSTVSDELSKTWNVVGRMQAQHQQLHTHEKILRYELQQKRKMLQELKQELEYCREKWESARQKNTNTEIEWKNLRREFAARKALAHDSFNNSAESGFSDDRCDDSDDEEGEAEERVRAGPRRRTRKESPRAPTPDTESEQPTDTEASDPKTESPDQRTPTPETSDGSSVESSKGPQNPLDQALANVIQNLIHVDGNQSTDDQKKAPSTAQRSSPSSNPEEESKISGNEETKNLQHEEVPQDHSFTPNHQHSAPEDTDKTPGDSSNLVSVFSIGPFPTVGKTVQFSDPLVVGPSNDLQGSLFGSQSNAKSLESTSRSSEGPEEVQGLTNEGGRPETEAERAREDDKEDLGGKIDGSSVDGPSASSSRASRTSEEVLAARDARLKRLEEQAEWLMKKMNATSRRGSALSTRLEELHEAYGEIPAPPPMPDVLPSVRIPTDPNAVEESQTAEPTGTPESSP